MRDRVSENEADIITWVRESPGGLRPTPRTRERGRKDRETGKDRETER